MPKLAAEPSEKEASAPSEVREVRPASGVVPSNKTQPFHVPAAPRIPSMDARVTGPRDLFVYAIVAGAIVGVLAWCALRYL